ncbi:diacylglycerol kinase family protein [Roseivirga pacifica]|uniref:diacylglycerol kinase family protein n=1 Tax=Roseivirga pacifica TaxID=1267423 RepID=UPI00227D4EA2|nr:diacylglycerol kinase family protein [Roseivirga pacifica]
MVKPLHNKHNLNELQKFKVALKGLMLATKSEAHFRFHILAALIIITAGWLMRVSKTDWLWLIAAIGFVLIAELFNTAIEHLVDLVSPEKHPLAGKIKDISAGAVLMASITAAVIGLVILWPYFCSIFN